MSWQTQKNKHSLSPAMKYTLSNRAVPFWIQRVGESKAQNKQHSDLAFECDNSVWQAGESELWAGCKNTSPDWHDSPASEKFTF